MFSSGEFIIFVLKLADDEDDDDRRVYAAIVVGSRLCIAMLVSLLPKYTRTRRTRRRRTSE